MLTAGGEDPNRSSGRVEADGSMDIVMTDISIFLYPDLHA